MTTMSSRTAAMKQLVYRVLELEYQIKTLREACETDLESEDAIMRGLREGILVAMPREWVEEHAYRHAGDISECLLCDATERHWVVMKHEPDCPLYRDPE